MERDLICDSFVGMVWDETVWLPSPVGRLALVLLLLSTCFAGTGAEVDSQLFISLLSSSLAPDMRTMKICLLLQEGRGHERNFKQTALHQLLYNAA